MGAFGGGGRAGRFAEAGGMSKGWAGVPAVRMARATELSGKEARGWARARAREGQEALSGGLGRLWRSRGVFAEGRSYSCRIRAAIERKGGRSTTKDYGVGASSVELSCGVSRARAPRRGVVRRMVEEATTARPDWSAGACLWIGGFAI